MTINHDYCTVSGPIMVGTKVRTYKSHDQLFGSVAKGNTVQYSTCTEILTHERRSERVVRPSEAPLVLKTKVQFSLLVVQVFRTSF